MAAASNGTMRVVLLGPPGSGKGTQAAIVAKRFGIPAISTGEMLRGAVEAGSELGARVEQVMAAGALVDDALMADVVSERLREPDAEDGFLLDGYPRTPSQAATLDTILENRRQALDRVILIDVPEAVLVARAVARQRADDEEKVVRERLRVYHEKTAALVDLYRGRNLLTEIDGDRPIEAVSADLEATLQ